MTFGEIGAEHLSGAEEGLPSGAAGEALEGHRLAVLCELDLAALHRSPEVGREAELLEPDVGSFHALYAAGTDQDVQIVGVHVAHHGEIADPSPDQLVDEGHGVVVQRHPAEVNTRAVGDQRCGLGQRVSLDLEVGHGRDLSEDGAGYRG